MQDSQLLEKLSIEKKDYFNGQKNSALKPSFARPLPPMTGIYICTSIYGNMYI
jgi:hypothetical protein